MQRRKRAFIGICVFAFAIALGLPKIPKSTVFPTTSLTVFLRMNGKYWCDSRSIKSLKIGTIVRGKKVFTFKPVEADIIRFRLLRKWRDADALQLVKNRFQRSCLAKIKDLDGNSHTEPQREVVPTAILPIPSTAIPELAKTVTPTPTPTRTWSPTPSPSRTITPNVLVPVTTATPPRATATGTATATKTNVPTATRTPTATATRTPIVLVPTATNTATPVNTATPTTVPNIFGPVTLSTNQISFTSSSGSGVQAIGIKPNGVVAAALSISGVGAGFRLLTAAEVTTHGGIPCTTSVNNHCEVLIGRTTSSAFAGSITINGQKVSVSGEGVAAAPVSLKKVKLETIAAAQGVNAQQLIQNTFAAMRPVSFDPADVVVFDNYATADWANTWINGQVDLSSVGWDAHQAGTAITRCHIVFANHYGRGGGITFNKKDGTVFSSTITASRSSTGVYSYMPMNDVVIARINPCLPDDMPVYSVLDSSEQMNINYFLDTPYLNTHFNDTSSSSWYGIRKISISSLTSLGMSGAGGSSPTTMPSFMFSSAVGGDSGNPSFLILPNNPILISTFTFGGVGGTGPNFADPTLQAWLEKSIAELN